MLLKGLDELRAAPNTLIAAEMVFIRLAYAADLPSPDDLLRQLKQSGGMDATGSGAASGKGGAGGPTATMATSASARSFMTVIGGGRGNAAVAHAPLPEASPVEMPHQATAAMAESASLVKAVVELKDFQQLVKLFEEKREAILTSQLFNDVRLVSFEDGRMEIEASRNLAPDFAGRVSSLLTEWCGKRWMVTISTAKGQPSLREQQVMERDRRMEEALHHPLVQQVLVHFPGAELKEVILKPVTEFAESMEINDEEKPHE
jgi:DNA polymerase-3 subunit gamma/tau